MFLRGDPRPTYAGENLREASVKTEDFSFRDSDNQDLYLTEIASPKKSAEISSAKHSFLQEDSVWMGNQEREATPIEGKRGDRNPRTER